VSRGWWIVGLLAAALFINYVDRGVLPTAAHLIQDELGFSPKQLGLLFSAFFWSYAVLQIPLGVFAERVSAARVLAVGLAIWACATILMGFVHSFAALLALRVLLGIGECAGFPCVAKIIATVMPVRRLGTANGIVAFAYLFGPAVGTWTGGLIMTHYGWRAAFWVFGAASLLWLLPWSRVRLPQVAPFARGGSEGPTFATILKQPALWGTSLGLFSSNYSFYFLLTWLPYCLVREHGFSTARMAGVMGSAFMLNALIALTAGWTIDRVIARFDAANVTYKGVMAVAHLGYVACMLCIALAPTPWVVGAIFAYQVFSGASSPGVYAVCQILAGPRASARWVGVQNASGNFAGAIAPALTGLLVGTSNRFTTAFLVAAGVSLLGLVGWVWMVPKLRPLTWVSGNAPADVDSVRSLSA
jgi:MFS family permease